eukprot:GHUV01026725.1.p1 GENE.GHUV01026725.1~~GHUV01026725.1.p1  ORF type:complete len:384 (+),score=121.40 GHUV01026725.1:1111-2262(+)
MNARSLASRLLNINGARALLHKHCGATTPKSVQCCSAERAPVVTSSRAAAVKRAAQALSILGASVTAKTTRRSSMYASVVLQERDVRRVVSSAVKTALAVPQHSWSADFVEDTIIGEITDSSTSFTEALAGGGPSHNGSSDSSTDHSETPGVGSGRKASKSKASKRASKDSKGSSNNNRTSSNSITVAATSEAVPDHTEVTLATNVAELLDAFAGGSDDAAEQRHFKASSNNSRGRHRHSDFDEDEQQQQQQQQVVLDELQTMFSQLLYDNYQQVEDEDVIAFCHKLLADLHHLVQQALEEQSEDMPGLCALCGRHMPLTKHHLIPRDVHKEFKKRGFTFDQLQSGLHVCRPCHSAIHKAVPDNKELAMHYSTLENLRQVTVF